MKTNKEIEDLAFKMSPVDYTNIGSGDTNKPYDQNQRDRNIFIQGYVHAQHDILIKYL